MLGTRGGTAPTAGSLDKVSPCTVLSPPPASTLGRGVKPVPKLMVHPLQEGRCKLKNFITHRPPSVKPGGTSPPKPVGHGARSITPHRCGSPHGIGIPITSSPSPPRRSLGAGAGDQKPKQLEGGPHPQAYQNASLAGEVLAFAALPARAAGAGGVPEQQPQHHGQAAPQPARHLGRGHEAGVTGGM